MTVPGCDVAQDVPIKDLGLGVLGVTVMVENHLRRLPQIGSDQAPLVHRLVDGPRGRGLAWIRLGLFAAIWRLFPVRLGQGASAAVHEEHSDKHRDDNEVGVHCLYLFLGG